MLRKAVDATEEQRPKTQLFGTTLKEANRTKLTLQKIFVSALMEFFMFLSSAIMCWLPLSWVSLFHEETGRTVTSIQWVHLSLSRTFHIFHTFHPR